MPHDLPKAYEPGAIEPRWAEYWVREKLFHVEIPSDPDQPTFTVTLPPPNVTGNLHMGHMLEHTEIDIIVRWKRMQGLRTLWLPGTDHAGIATQLMVERQLAAEGQNRRDMGREAFIARVWDWKQHYGGVILQQMKRLGASVDWSREYFTMDERMSRAVREAFVRLHEEGLIYRGKYIVNWCPRCITAVSDLEVVHEDTPGKIYEIRYPVIGSKDEYIVVATTRPETMLGDTAVAVNSGDERYRHLHGKKVLLPLMNREIPIITDDILANPEFGTGAVKVTPAHDPNDFEAGLRNNLPQIDVMNEVAQMNENAGPYQGLDRFEARQKVLEDLERGGFLVGAKDYVVPLGKCDRCKTIVEPRLSTQWFVKIQPLADRAIEVVENGDIKFVPENYSKTYFEWMRNIHDWCISRQLWWGHRIPAWHCKDCHEIIVARETPAKCAKCGGRPSGAGQRRTRHLVLVGPVAVLSVGLARQHARSRRLLPDDAAHHGLRHPVLLGGAHDHAELPLHARTHAWRRSVSYRAYPRSGTRRRASEDVEDQRQRHGSHRDHRAVRHRRGALHAGCHGSARRRYRFLREPHRKLSRLRQQDLERRALPVHER